MTTRRDADGGQLRRRRRRRQSKQASKHHPSPPSVPSLPIYHSAQSAQASLRYELFYEDGSDEDDDDDNSSDDAHCPRRPASSHPLRLLSNQSAALASCGLLSLLPPTLSSIRSFHHGSDSLRARDDQGKFAPAESWMYAPALTPSPLLGLQETAAGEDEALAWAVSNMQGW